MTDQYQGCPACVRKRKILITSCTVEDVLSYRIYIGDSNLKVMVGAIEGISKEGQNELLSALMNYIRSTKRFC